MVLIGSMDVGGAEMHLTRVLPALSSDRRQIRVVCFQKGGALAHSLESQGVEVKFPKMSMETGKISTVKRLAKVLVSISFLVRELHSYKPDVAHYFLPEAYILGGFLSLILGPKYRVMSRRSRNFYHKRSPFTRIERLLHGRMDRILANSKANLADLKSEGAPHERLTLCFNGIDATHYGNVSARAGRPLYLPINDGDLVITCVANLIPYKGHADIISALKIIRDQKLIIGNSHLKMLFVGRDSGVWKDLEQQSVDAGLRDQLFFLGPRSNVGEILALSDIGILASHEEGMSNALLEYMCCSLPIVATDVGGNRETLGEAGRLVPPASPHLMAAALADLCNDLDAARLLGKQARLRVEEKFPIHRTIQIYGEVYDSLTL